MQAPGRPVTYFQRTRERRKRAAEVTRDSDEECMLRYAAGELAAFLILYERHRGGLYRFFLSHVLNIDRVVFYQQYMAGRGSSPI